MKRLRNFIRDKGIEYILFVDDDLSDDDDNPVIGFCLGDKKGDIFGCGYLFGIGISGAKFYNDVCVPGLSFDLEDHDHLKMIGVDMI